MCRQILLSPSTVRETLVNATVRQLRRLRRPSEARINERGETGTETLRARRKRGLEVAEAAWRAAAEDLVRRSIVA
jgi:hypothetical protein